MQNRSEITSLSYVFEQESEVTTLRFSVFTDLPEVQVFFGCSEFGAGQKWLILCCVYNQQQQWTFKGFCFSGHVCNGFPVHKFCLEIVLQLLNGYINQILAQLHSLILTITVFREGHLGVQRHSVQLELSYVTADICSQAVD